MSDQPTNDLTECAECGAAVLNVQAHKHWHDEGFTEKLVRDLQRAQVQAPRFP